MELPIEFLKEMKEILGPEYEAFLKSYEGTGFRGLRVNTRKIKGEEFERISPFSLERIPWIPNGYYLDKEAPASKHPFYQAGLYYLQEPSAMTPASLLPIEEGDCVLDLCAAPGGKATELAARLRGTGLLVANDVSNSRAKGLLKNLELFGAGNILVTSETPERLASYFEGFFDKILIDAPCSGEGMFRKEPSMVKDWKERGPAYYGRLQREIVRQAARMLKPGGLLLYSTCTFSPLENEGTVAELLSLPGNFHVEPLKPFEGFSPGRPDLLREGGKEELVRCLRLYPHKIRGEGHFAALLKKGEAIESPSAGKKNFRGKPAPVPKEWESFSGLLNISIPPESLRLYGNKLYSLPEALYHHSIRGLRFLRTGLYLGEAEKKRFEPSQALAMFLKKEDFSACLDFSASDSRIARYLKGETLDAEDLLTAGSSGWQLICLEGYPLGWGKAVNGMLRNKYYAGWRQ